MGGPRGVVKRDPPFRQQSASFSQHLREYFCAVNDRHKVRVARPARDNVQVQVIPNRTARGSPEVAPPVNGIRMRYRFQHPNGSPREFHQLA